LDSTWADAFVAEALRLKVRVILVIGGFPCKGLSHARGASRENLKNKDSILCWELTRILELMKRAAGNSIPVKHIVENVMMDAEPENIISEHLGERATKISASPVCAAGRDRLFWFDFQLQPLEDESLIKGTTRNELILEPDAERLDFWDEGWGPTQQFDGTMPTVQGWQTWTKQPKDPRGIHIRSKEAIARWEQDKWSSAITFYEEKNMALCLEPATAETENLRVISPTEAERLLGFPTDWTRMAEPDNDTRQGQNKRKNAVGNAFAVPVITRLLMALCMCFDPVKASSTSLWECQSLPAPLHADTLDDLLEPAYALAQ
jgi:site-specific DNA-cytosine methylase